MHLDEAQTIVRSRTACVAISLESLTASMADLDLRWMAFGTEHGLRVRIFTTSVSNWEDYQLEFTSKDYHATHALTYALAKWFLLQAKD